MKKSIAILQHVSFENPGSIIDWIRYRDYTCSVYELYNSHTLPRLNDFDWLIVMGGPMGTRDTNRYSWLQPEKDLIKHAISSGKTVLGICLGAQLLAEALGANVYRCPEKEIGWWPVDLTGAGVEIFNAPRLDVFQWHGDTFDLPAGAELVASSAACPHQAFIYHRNVVALQFHLEIKEDIIAALLVEGKEELVDGKFIQRPESITANAGVLEKYHLQMVKILEYLDQHTRING